MSIVPDRHGTPFVRVCATGYYDGPLSGWTLDREGAVYMFEMVDADDGQDVRVFAI
ncbi:MAG: hypothetical protein IPL61_39135 [Myxococcales bacterium]|nr:hypothetical protein [Myxococcales bacterium]